MGDSSLLGKAVKTVRGAGKCVYDHRHDIIKFVSRTAINASVGILCSAIGRHYGYFDGYSDGWLCCDRHTKEILEAASKSHETIIKQ